MHADTANAAFSRLQPQSTGEQPITRGCRAAPRRVIPGLPPQLRRALLVACFFCVDPIPGPSGTLAPVTSSIPFFLAQGESPFSDAVELEAQSIAQRTRSTVRVVSPDGTHVFLAVHHDGGTEFFPKGTLACAAAAH